MLLLRSVLCMVSAGMALAGAGVASGQTFRDKPVRIVTIAPGGGADFLARVIASGLSGVLGQQVVVENRGGGTGVIAIETVATAPADGYTLLLYSNAMWLLPFLRDDLRYDPVKDFSPITMATRTPNVLVVHPSLPVKSVRELIALAKGRPRELNFGSGGTGTSTHIAAEVFKAMAGIDIVHVPYKGIAPAVNDLLGGRMQMVFTSGSTLAPHIKSGRLRALAVTTAQSTALYPDLPTVAATVPGYEAATSFGIFVRAATPTAAVMRLNQYIVGVLTSAPIKDKLFGAGSEVIANSPEQCLATIKHEMATVGKLIKGLGIRE